MVGTTSFEMVPRSHEVRAQLALIEKSTTLGALKRLMTLLSYLVEKGLTGKRADLSEVAVGNAVYKRSPPYDPRIDSTVRVEVRRLRRKLAQYYAAEGRRDPVHIALPVGTYVPCFTARYFGETCSAAVSSYCSVSS